MISNNKKRNDQFHLCCCVLLPAFWQVSFSSWFLFFRLLHFGSCIHLPASGRLLCIGGALRWSSGPRLCTIATWTHRRRLPPKVSNCLRVYCCIYPRGPVQASIDTSPSSYPLGESLAVSSIVVLKKFVGTASGSYRSCQNMEPPYTYSVACSIRRHNFRIRHGMQDASRLGTSILL